jgi:hypothetical protein
MSILAAATFGQSVAEVLVWGFFVFGAIKLVQFLKTNPAAGKAVKKGGFDLLKIFFKK